MKITHQLGLAGWITTVRGKGGGMRLAMAPKSINLGELVRSVEPDFHLVECLAESAACHLLGRCRLEGVFTQALGAFMQSLDGHTLADVLPPPGRAAPDVAQAMAAPISRRKGAAA